MTGGQGLRVSDQIFYSMMRFEYQALLISCLLWVYVKCSSSSFGQSVSDSIVDTGLVAMRDWVHFRNLDTLGTVACCMTSGVVLEIVFTRKQDA